MRHTPRRALKAAYSRAFIGALLCVALAGCATVSEGASGGAAAPTTTSAATTQPAATETPTDSGTGAQPTPILPGTFATYTNSTYGYSITYPQNWGVEGANPAAQAFLVFNYNPQTLSQPTSAPPLLKIEIDAVPNPTNLSPLALFNQSTSGPGQPAVTIQSSQAITLAGRSVQQIIAISAASPYPTIYDLIPTGAVTLVLFQTNAVNGQPAPVFTQMLASFKVTG